MSQVLKSDEACALPSAHLLPIFCASESAAGVSQPRLLQQRPSLPKRHLEKACNVTHCACVRTRTRARTHSATCARGAPTHTQTQTDTNTDTDPETKPSCFLRQCPALRHTHTHMHTYHLSPTLTLRRDPEKLLENVIWDSRIPNPETQSWIWDSRIPNSARRSHPRIATPDFALNLRVCGKRAVCSL